MVTLLFGQMSEKRLVFSIVMLGLTMDMASSASVSLQGNISPCKAPCTQYGIVVTARVKRLELKVYKALRRVEVMAPEVSDTHQLLPSPSHWQTYITNILFYPNRFYKILKRITESAKKVIPFRYQFSTPFIFMVPESEMDVYKEAFKAIITRVNIFLNDLNNHPFLPPSVGSIRIIEAEEEIVFKWLTANFLAGFFSKENSDLKAGLLSLNRNAVTQIAYPVHKTSMNTTQFVTIGTTPYLIIAKSYTEEGFGNTLQKYFAKVVQVNSANKQSPCTPKGSRVKVTDGSIRKEFIGSGNVKECRDILTDVVLNSYDRYTRSPYIQKPSKLIKFYVLPEVIQVLNAIGCAGCDKAFTAAKIDTTARQYCSVQKSSKGNLHSTKDCLDANFYYIMLTVAYHLDRNLPITVLPKLKNGIEEDWALGGFLKKTRLLSRY